MKTVFIFSIFVLAGTVSTPTFAASEHAGHGVMTAQGQSQAQTPTNTSMTDGVVKKVDKATGKVTLSHGPLPNLGMGMPMTMVFRVKDAAWLNQLKENDKIRFMADNVNGAITVIHFEHVK